MKFQSSVVAKIVENERRKRAGLPRASDDVTLVRMAYSAPAVERIAKDDPRHTMFDAAAIASRTRVLAAAVAARPEAVSAAPGIAPPTAEEIAAGAQVLLEEGLAQSFAEALGMMAGTIEPESEAESFAADLTTLDGIVARVMSEFVSSGGRVPTMPSEAIDMNDPPPAQSEAQVRDRLTRLARGSASPDLISALLTSAGMSAGLANAVREWVWSERQDHAPGWPDAMALLPVDDLVEAAAQLVEDGEAQTLSEAFGILAREDG